MQSPLYQCPVQISAAVSRHRGSIFGSAHGPHHGTLSLWADYIQITRTFPGIGGLLQKDYIVPRVSATVECRKADIVETVAFPTSPRDRITVQGQIAQYPDGQIRISVYSKDNMETLWSALTRSGVP